MLRFRIITIGFDGEPGYNVFHTQGDDFSGVEARADGFREYMDVVRDAVSSECTMILDDVAYLVDPVTGDTTGATPIVPTSFAGEQGATHVVGGACGLIRWRTGVYSDGREIRGRTFVAGLGDVSDPEGNVVAGAVTIMQNAADALLAVGDLGVWRRPRPDTSPLGPRPGQFALVTGRSVWSEFALLRTRRD